MRGKDSTQMSGLKGFAGSSSLSVRRSCDRPVYTGWRRKGQ